MSPVPSRARLRVRIVTVVLTAVVLVPGVVSCTGPPQPDSSAPDPSAARAEELRLLQPRAVHRAVPLTDGSVLVLGGCTTPGCGGFEAGRRTELFRPGRGFVAGPAMALGRAGGTATRLLDGRVLVTGGHLGEGAGPTGSVEIFDPAAGRFTVSGDLEVARADHSASLLADGRVLLAGGFDATGAALASTEVFDPTTGTLRAGPALSSPRAAHVGVVLGDTVLLVGGTRGSRALESTEILRGGAWSPGPELGTPRVKMGVAALDDVRALVVGGARTTEGRRRLATTEIVDLTEPRALAGPSMSAGEFKLDGAMTSLADGRVVIASGSALEVFDPDDATMTRTDVDLPGGRSFRTVTALTDGSVLVAGGYDEQIRPSDAARVVRIPARAPRSTAPGSTAPRSSAPRAATR